MYLLLKAISQGQSEKWGELYRSWGLYILVHDRARQPKRFCQPRPPTIFDSSAVSFSFYLLTYSQLGSFSSTTAWDRRMGRAVCQGGTIPQLNLYFNHSHPFRGGKRTPDRGSSWCL